MTEDSTSEGIWTSTYLVLAVIFLFIVIALAVVLQTDLGQNMNFDPISMLSKALESMRDHMTGGQRV